MRSAYQTDEEEFSSCARGYKQKELVPKELPLLSSAQAARKELEFLMDSVPSRLLSSACLTFLMKHVQLVVDGCNARPTVKCYQKGRVLWQVIRLHTISRRR